MEIQKKNGAELWFKIGMVWRMIYGTVRIVLGLELLRLVGMPLISIFNFLMGGEFKEDPYDAVMLKVSHLLTSHPVQITYFLAIYFIFWGLIDVGLSWNLLKKKLWAFPVSLVLIAGFTFYEIWRFFHTYSLILLWIILVDIAILYLIYKEYKKLRI